MPKEIIREAYIKAISSSLFDNRKRIDKLHSKDLRNMTQSQRSKHEASLNWEFMFKSKNEERLGYALGYLKISDLRSFYEPSSYHKYDGVKSEMENIKFI
jgi:hypothetical protein